MSIPTQALRYGWVALATLSITGATIFVANNTLRQITPATVIQIVLGTAERCYATQTGTNPVTGKPVYAVDPPIIIRSWYSNSYETQVVAGVTGVVAVLHTNIMTNAIGWRTDRAMMVNLDATIKALVPYYVDTNTVCDGMTNIAMLTVTGLWASLAIGDHTNQFTQTPEWTDTNGVTHAATFGPWAWRNYVLAWQERYKVLNALKYTLATVSVSNEYRYGEGSTNGGGLDFSYGFDSTTMVATAMDNWEKAKQLCDDMAETNVLISAGDAPEDKSGGAISLYSYTRWFYTTGATARKTIWTKLFMTYGNTLGGSIDYYTKNQLPYPWRDPGDLGGYAYVEEYDANGTPNAVPYVYYKMASFSVVSNATSSYEADICEDASWGNDPEVNHGGYSMRGFSVWASYPYPDSGHFVIFRPSFNYCTEKFW